MDGGAWWAAVHGVTEGQTWLSDFTFSFHFHALEKEMATHSSVVAWRISGMGEPGGLPSMGSHRVGHDWSDLAAAAAVAFCNMSLIKFSSIQLFSHVRLLATPWTAVRQASLSITNSQSPRKPCPLSRWCYPTISSSVIPVSCPQSFPASGSFQMS